VTSALTHPRPPRPRNTESIVNNNTMSAAGASAAAIAAAVLDEPDARIFGSIVADATDASPLPTLRTLAARFCHAFPPGHARFAACCAAALTLEATRRAPPGGPSALIPGQRVALWHCLLRAFVGGDEGEGDGGGSGGRNNNNPCLLLEHPFLPLVLRALASPSSSLAGPSSSSTWSPPEKGYLVRALRRALEEDDGGGGIGSNDAEEEQEDDLLPPSAAVARIARLELEEGDVEALCARCEAAAEVARKARGRRRGGGGRGASEAALSPSPWLRPAPVPLPPMPGELVWLYPPLPQEGGRSSGFLWDAAMGTEAEEEEEEEEEEAEERPPSLRMSDARALVARALRGPLPPGQQQRVLDAVFRPAARPADAPPRSSLLGIDPRPASRHLPLLVEHAPALAYGLLVGGGGGGGGGEGAARAPAEGLAMGPRGLAFLEAALLQQLHAGGVVTLASLELAHRLASAHVLPRNLLRTYVAGCLESCEQGLGGGGGGDGARAGVGEEGGGGGVGGGGGDPGGGASERLVRLVCVFLTSLVKSGALFDDGGREDDDYDDDDDEEEEEEEQGVEVERGGSVESLRRRGQQRWRRGDGDGYEEDDGPDGDPLLHQLRAFCVSFSRVREAAALFQLLQSGGVGGVGG
jgi:hypothetical protein